MADKSCLNKINSLWRDLMGKINNRRIKTLIKIVMTSIEIVLIAICIFLVIGGIYTWLSGARREACIIVGFAGIYIFYFLILEFWERGSEKNE